MRALASGTQLWSSVRFMYMSALVIFVITIVIGILNGLDLYEPDHDTLITHVHAGTLGWITLAVAGTIMLTFSTDRTLTRSEESTGRALAVTMVTATGLYVAAFLVGDRIPGDRIQRPIAGTLLLLVVVWFLVWAIRQNAAFTASSVARYGLLLAWVSLLVGAVLGIVLGIYSSQGEVPGLADDTAARLADAHPPAMVIGFLVLAGMAVIEWLIRPVRSLGEDRWGAAQMSIIFVAGILINVAFIIDSEALLGPANGMEILGVIILVARLWRHLVPSALAEGGTATYGRLSILFLILDLAVLTYLVSKVMAGTIDFDAPSEADLGLILTLDHLMFIGVMTNALFGAIAVAVRGGALAVVDRIVMWGTNVGLVGFALGLITTTQVLKRISAPVMGTALLVGIVIYLSELQRTGRRTTVAV
jgi:hypothetical protein